MSDEERMSDRDSDQDILGLIYPVVSKVLESQALGRRFMPFPPPLCHSNSLTQVNLQKSSMH